jgi:hypothetical protein
MKKLVIEVEAEEEWSIIDALNHTKQKIEEGFTSGSLTNESNEGFFELTETAE